MKRRQGFTLLELMIVVVILGVLALIAVPALLNAASNSREGVTRANVSAAASSIVSNLTQNTVSIPQIVADLNLGADNPFTDTEDDPVFEVNATCSGAGMVAIDPAGTPTTGFNISGCGRAGTEIVNKFIPPQQQ